MKLWRTSVYYADGVALVWSRSQREARAQRRELRAQFCYADGTPAQINPPEAVDIPTDKAGLVVWLNSHLSSDNG